jgi:glycine cleavage system regulatory protein
MRLARQGIESRGNEEPFMKTYLVVTLTCPDRPGIVERLTEVIAPFGANWEESRLARLGGEFAGILLIGVDEPQAAACMDALRGIADDQTAVVVKRTVAPEPNIASDAALYELRLSGADHEGIVHKVAAYLAGRGINVEDMETDVVPAPVTATPLFQMTAKLKVPAETAASELLANLERVGDDLGVDIELNACGD